MARIIASINDISIIMFLTPFATFLLFVLASQDNNKKVMTKMSQLETPTCFLAVFDMVQYSFDNYMKQNENENLNKKNLNHNLSRAKEILFPIARAKRGGTALPI